MRLLLFVARPDEPGVHGDRRAVVVRAGRVVLVDEVVVVLVDVSDEPGVVHGDRGVEYLYLSFAAKESDIPVRGFGFTFLGVGFTLRRKPSFPCIFALFFWCSQVFHLFPHCSTQ